MEIPNYLLINKRKQALIKQESFKNKRKKEICKSIIKSSIPQVVLKSIRVVDNNMGLVISFSK